MNTTPFDELRSHLTGQTLLVVGGDPRPQALRRLEEAFDLGSVVHCPTRKVDASPRSFLSHLGNPKLMLVVWALGLSRTAHGTELHRRCRQLEIPWVDSFRIPHPNLLAARLVELHLLDALLRRRTLFTPAQMALPRAQIGGAR